MTILVYAANARALWDTIQADIPAIGAGHLQQQYLAQGRQRPRHQDLSGHADR